MEPRYHINSPLSPNLTLLSFINPMDGSMGLNADQNAVTLVPDITSTVSAIGYNDHQLHVDGTDYNNFVLQFNGTITIAPGAAGTYFFRAPSADGALLSIDGNAVIWRGSWIGDANLDGQANSDDNGNVLGFNYGSAMDESNPLKAWISGDLLGNGQVNADDLNTFLAEGYGSGTPAARSLDNTIASEALGMAPPVGIYLGAGTHNFSFAYTEFQQPGTTTHGDQNASATLQWAGQNGTATNADGTFAAAGAFQNINTSGTIYVTPATGVTATAGQDFSGAVAAFTPATPTAVATDYTSTVTWGTGSAAFTTTGTVASDGGSGFVVSTQAAASHFTAAGSMAFSVRVTHTASAFTGARSGTATILSSAPAAPNPVTGLTTTLSTDGTSAALAWTTTSGASSLIRRSSDGGTTWQTLATLSPGVGSFTDPVLAGNTNYTYSVTARTSASDSSSGVESAPALAIATTSDTGILGGGRAFFPGVTDSNSSNTDGGLTYSGPVGTESLTASDQSSYPNFKASKFAGLFSNGEHADFGLNGVPASTAPVLMHTDFTFFEVIDSTADQTRLTPDQVAQDVTINGTVLASPAGATYTVHALGTAPQQTLCFPDSNAGSSCIAYQAIVAFTVSASFCSNASTGLSIALSGLPQGQKGGFAAIKLAGGAGPIRLDAASADGTTISVVGGKNNPANVATTFVTPTDAQTSAPILLTGTTIDATSVTITGTKTPVTGFTIVSSPTAGGGGKETVTITVPPTLPKGDYTVVLDVKGAAKGTTIPATITVRK